MRGIGRGGLLWRAEVVLQVPGPVSDLEERRLQEDLLGAVAKQLERFDVVDVSRMQDLTATWSYDIPPPKPDAGIGVACWVLADSVGWAAETAWQVVDTALRSLAIAASLWDLRVLPRSAILSAADRGVTFN